MCQALAAPVGAHRQPSGRRRAAPLGLALAAMLCPAVGAAASAPPEGPLGRLAAQMGSLQRTAAGLDDALDVYRLAAGEVVPALALVLAAGGQPGAGPATPLPPAARAAFRRLASSVSRRVAAAALPAVARAYHSEVVLALEALAAAPALAAVPAPAAALQAALAHQAALVDEVVDVFSRQRATLDAELDPSTALDEIGEALAQLGLAEANIAAVHARHGSQGEQLQAFLRLEVALGHALDMIAAAEEAGVHIGFELSRSTVGLTRRLQALRGHLAGLAGLTAALAQAPRAPVRGLAAQIVEGERGAAEAVLQWTAPPSRRAQVAALRVSRRLNVAAVQQQLRLARACDGLLPAAAAAAAVAATAGLDDAPQRVAELPPETTAAREPLPGLPPAPPAYRVVAVSPFGIEGAGAEVVATVLGRDLAPPLGIRAHAAAPAPTDESFYRDLDAVVIDWQPSPSDVAGGAAAQGAAAAQHLPTVARYAVFRLGPEGPPQHVGSTPAGLTQFVDRPPHAALAAGVRYAVEAVDGAGKVARGAQVCALSEPVTRALGGALQEAAAGAAACGQPPQAQQQRAAELAEPAALAAAQAAFAARPAAAQAVLLQQFWGQSSAQTRLSWYHSWPAYLDGEQRAAWLGGAAAGLRQRDLVEAQLEAFLAAQPALQVAIDETWELLGEAGQTAASRTYEARLNRTVRNGLALPEAAAGRAAHLAAVRRWAWWQGRDAEEQERLRLWWAELPAAAQAAARAAYVRRLPRPAQQAVAWPDWEQLTAAEREAYLRAPPTPLAAGLWPFVLAWAEWHEAPEAVRAAAYEAEVGPLVAALSHLRFALRPLDVWFDFRLLTAVGVVALGALSGLLLQLAGRQPPPP